jgi:soluble lytic murein transglycosylase-like protein
MKYLFFLLFPIQLYASSLDSLFTNVSNKYSLPKGLLKAICLKETGLKNVVNWNDGASPSYGYCQVKMSTALQMRYKNTIAHLNTAKINIEMAGLYLDYLFRKCNSNWVAAVAAYNTGRCLKNPLTRYSKDVILKWEAILNAERNASFNR